MDPAANPPMDSAMDAIRQEPADFDQIASLYWPRVFRFALASLRDPDDALAVTQTCFLKAHNALAGFRGDSSILTWLMQIAVNLVRDRARTRAFRFWKEARNTAVRPEDLALSDSGLSPEAQFDLRAKVREVWRAVERLPDKQKTVFLLRFLDEMEILEIAAATGMKEGTVKAHLFRAVRTVRARVERRP